MPIGVKDLAATAGIRTTYSSRAYASHVPDFDTAVVRRIREAGFVIVGKTNTPEFGTVAFTESDLNGATRNPWDTELTPGGSSGGSAAAVSAGLVPIAHATDGGGSIRIPASCCGLFGTEALAGRVSSAPFSSLEGLSTAGPLARTSRTRLRCSTSSPATSPATHGGHRPLSARSRRRASSRRDACGSP